MCALFTVVTATYFTATKNYNHP
ncbi:MAG: hypothetical protein KDG51_13035 [Calditrichaeota bacterium]|nr:hypothetical protein [Calditrichota bacterium]